MSVCPTCGHGAELVHSTPPRLDRQSQWHADLAELIALVHTAVAQHRGPFMTPFHVEKRRRERERALSRKAA